MKKKTRLVISETSSSTWHYHLRKVIVGEEKYSGGAGPALCGHALGWDTRIPLTDWGLRTHVPERFCEECLEIAKANGLWDRHPLRREDSDE